MTYAEIEESLDRMFGLKKRMAESKAEGKAEGEARGKAKGRQEGVNLMLDLIMQGLTPAEAAQRVKDSADELVTV